MIVLSNATAQTLAPGQSIIFDTVTMRSGNGDCCHRPGSSAVKMKCRKTYEISFSANVSSATAGATAVLAIEVGGEVLPETTMKSTSTDANDLNNVATSTAYRNGCYDYDRVTVTNIGTADVTIDANPKLMIK